MLNKAQRNNAVDMFKKIMTDNNAKGYIPTILILQSEANQIRIESFAKLGNHKIKQVFNEINKQLQAGEYTGGTEEKTDGLN